MAYARDVTGVHLDGNAAAWWPHAEGRYERGHKPEVGAILVFKPYGRMHVGHVAVVSQVVNSREVLVDQANWVRGRVTTAMSVVDASPDNDWTSVKVQFQGTHGRENPTYGFIYPHTVPLDDAKAVAAAEPGKLQPAHTEHAAAHAKHHQGADEQDAAAQDDPAPRHAAAHAKHHKDDGEQDAAAQDDPAPRHAAAHAKHHKDDGDREAAAATNAPPPHQVAEHAARHRDKAAPEEAKADVAAAPADKLAAAQPAHHKHHKAEDTQFAGVY